jgi:hypothetical protein
MGRNGRAQQRKKGADMSETARLDAALVEEFVGKAHGDLNRVKELLAQEPRLVNAAWDWGNGDWETALGAAAHMGRRDIAEYLLEQGARLDIFAAAMLGQLEIIQAMVRAYPAIVSVLGPHEIPLLQHAEKGAEAAAAVVEFLQGAG